MTSPNPCPLRLVISGLLIAGSAALLGGCTRDASETGKTASPSPAYVAFARGRVDVEGGLVPVASSCNGLIKDVRVEEGDEVRAGQILAVIDDRQARLVLAVSTAALAEAKAALLPIQVRVAAAKREVACLPKETTAEADVEKANDRLAELQAEIAVTTAATATAEARMRADDFEVENHAVHAPVDGRIVRRTARSGDVVNTLSSAPLFLLSPHAPQIVRTDLDERFVGKVTPGMAVEVVFDNDDKRVLPGRVLRLGEVFGSKQPTGEPGELIDRRAVECIVALNANNISLRIGQRVLVRFPNP